MITDKQLVRNWKDYMESGKRHRDMGKIWTWETPAERSIREEGVQYMVAFQSVTCCL